jgi:HD-GYP domain-containing protein (c-di-GMP phosphodiesterase class II)
VPVVATEQPSELARGAVLPVAIGTLSPGAVLEFDLYIQRRASDPLLLYRSRRIPLEQAALDRLAARGVHTLYIQTVDCGAYQHYLRQEVIQNEQLAPSRRYQVMQDATRAVFDTVILSGDVGRTVEFTIELGTQVAEIICHSDLVLRDLFSLMEHDYYTYTHAMNVGACAVALAKRTGVCDAPQLPELAAGGLLHDIGKREIDGRVLNKTGALRAKERVALQQHPKTGFELLCRRDDLTWGQLMMVYQHHERLGGQGYPAGVAREDIHPWARVCGVVDVFDAMTSVRSYHDANPLGSALDYLERQAGNAFDADMVRCWVEMVR